MSAQKSPAVRVLDFVSDHSLLSIAWGTGICGLLAGIVALPPALRGVLMLLFLLGAPGSAVMSWSQRSVPLSFMATIVPVTGFALWIVVVTASVSVPWWEPRVLLVASAVLSISVAQIAAVRNRAPVTGELS